MPDRRRRVLYVVGKFPELSETYIRTELGAVRDDYDVELVSLYPADMTYDASDVTWRTITDDVDAVHAAIVRARPDVVHVHFVTHVPVVAAACRRAGIPFTVRSHSFDVIGTIFPAARRRNALRPRRRAAVRAIVEGIASQHCLGVLAFPFMRPAFAALGIDHKVIDCHPVIDHARFSDRSPNGDGVMNLGAASPKKDMPAYLDLAAATPDIQFDLYPVAKGRERLVAENERRGNPVRIMPAVDLREMPAEYKRHRWLVYTASPRIGTVGWPLAIAEAQASGTGVCIPRIRPDLDDYVDGGGFVVDSVAEIADIIRQPVPDAVRERGFEVARRCDIQRHKHLLTDLWDGVAI
jgi:hypothetical protein